MRPPELPSMTTKTPSPEGGAEGQPFEAFYAAQFARLATIAAAVSGDAATGEDLAQEALEQARSHWARLASYEDPSAWVRRVTVNMALNRRRRLAAEARALLRLRPAARAEGSDPPLHGEPAVWRAVAALPPRQRAAVALFYLEDRPVSEIADALGVSVSTATSTLHQARRRLARDLGPPEPTGGNDDTRSEQP